jgi:uncharacterized membrane protein YccF (DUF307 family)
MERQRVYKGVTVLICGGWLCDYTYLLDGMMTVRGLKSMPTSRAAWKAAKSEITRKQKGNP